jgi:hypothetical protein
MRGSHDQFFLQYGGEIRESLIMIEGDDGSFELLAHGWVPASMAMTAPLSLWSEAATPIVYTCWSPSPIAILGTYTTGIGSETMLSGTCTITSSGCGVPPHLECRAAPTGSSVHQKSR